MNLTINNALIKLLKQYTSLSEIAPRAVAGEKPLSPRELSFLRRVLLLYHPNTALSWILHTAFYILCFFVVAFFLIVVAVPPYHIDYLIGWAVIVAPIVPVLLIIQWLARRHTAHSEDTENPAILVHQD
jgi:Flp pilus assembly protein TadB